MKKTEKMSEYLPEEVLIQILIRLPVKSILKFSCVCKLWNSIIKNPHFISTFSSNKHHHYYFLCHSYNSNQYTLRFDNKHLDEYVSIHLSTKPVTSVWLALVMVLSFSVSSDNEAVLYSLNSNSWKKITNVACKFRKDGCRLVSLSFVDGRFYWPIIAEKKEYGVGV
ncbi:putative F-box protein At3g52320 [Mercurialis annua]|uniref:putative F-box protein At3g52320 n=1 Tax=Mercurialis annua TaxID=3986 RepID=UPI0024AFC9DA|nr:putative F-box protein At3g52320 [Mercurialis annua]